MLNGLHTTGTDLDEQTHCKTTESCDNTLIVLVKKIYSDLTTMKERLSQPIVETNIQFSYLHDEMTSVKKSTVVHGEITESQFDTIKDTTDSIKETIENDAKKVEHRFQAIHDSLQNIHDNVKLSKLKLVPNGKDTTETIQKEKNNQPNLFRLCQVMQIITMYRTPEMIHNKIVRDNTKLC